MHSHHHCSLPSATESRADSLLAARPVLGNNYFNALAAGTMELETFRKTQRQFFFAVGFFSRALAALTARLPASGDREILVHNLAEEHGLDEEQPGKGFRGDLAHDRTFLCFLQSLDPQIPVAGGEEPAPAVQAFNLALLGACSMETPGFAFCALGIVESAFADISALIARRVVELGWVAAEDLVHYNLHADIDKRHAAELFEAAEQWERSSEPGPGMLGGLAFGRHIFDRLYTDLLTEAL